MSKVTPAPRNRTLTITKREIEKFSKNLLTINGRISKKNILNKTINGDVFSILPYLPDEFIDLLIIDPPYNMNKTFGAAKFKASSIEQYSEWMDDLINGLNSKLKKTASIYVCGDWKSSTSIHLVLSKYFIVRNRITWEREKGRGAKANWKSNSEDIWFCTNSDDYFFDVDSVKLKRRVLAPYRDTKGDPKDWTETKEGSFRLTHPSNLWNDISIPFWSMRENKEHPTQKPEKLIAKLVLASSKPKDIVFDPFVGSGTTSVVAKKLERKYVGIEIDEKFACLTEKRLKVANMENSIQGYRDGFFWERNSNKNYKKQI